MDQPITTKASSEHPGGSLIAAGSLAGIAGGIAMAAYLVFAAMVEGLGPFTALEPIGAAFEDPTAVGENGPSLIFGLFLHLATSAIIGLLFATILPRDFPPVSAAMLCVGFAFAAMGVMTACVVPTANPVLKESFHGLGGSWVIAHAVFGATVGYVCQRLRRALALRAVPRARERAA